MHLRKQNKEKALGENRLILYLFSKSLVLEMMDLCSGGWFRSIIKCTWLIKGHAPKTGVLLLLLATLMQSNQHRWQTETKPLLKMLVFIWINRMMSDCLECPYRLIVPTYPTWVRPPFFVQKTVLWEEWSEVLSDIKISYNAHHSFPCNPFSPSLQAQKQSQEWFAAQQTKAENIFICLG